MDNHNAHPVVVTPPVTAPQHDELLTGGEPGTLWSLVADRLRGRWRFSVATSVLLAVVFGTSGYLSTGPKYESSGLIRIAPTILPTLRDTPETGVMPLYQNFVATQVNLIGSRPVLERALADEALAALPWAWHPNALRRLQKGLDVEAISRTELIAVRFEASEPHIVHVAVNAVLKAYEELNDSAAGGEVDRKLSTLTARRNDLRSQREENLAQMQAVVSESEYGTDDLGQVLQARIARVEQLEGQVDERELALTRAAAPGSAPEDATAAPTLQQLVLFDGQLAEYRRLHDNLEAQLQMARTQWTSEHPACRRLERALQAARELFEERLVLARAAWASAVERGELPLADPTAGPSPAQIETEIELLKSQALGLRDEIQQISADQRKLKALREHLRQIEEDWHEIGNRIKYLEIEADSVTSGRISIAAYGEPPIGASRDRRAKLAAIGGLGGLGLGFGLFFFIGTVDRRLYRSLQLRNRRGVHCLGVLPDLSRGQLDPESSAAAAYCVHQIRNHIEAVRRPGPGFVLAITSPIPGQGKTSVVTALGWSYAAAGNRTVLVDCDMAVGMLSRQLGLADQPGLKEALRDGTCNGQTCVLSCPNLTVLPAGTDPLVRAEAIRKQDIEAVLEHLRRDFDVVLVDTGPMPVSLESLPLAAAADGVVIVCRRGARRSRLEECIEFLSEVGAVCVGIVLNCAARADCERYVSSSSLSAPPRNPDDSSRAARELRANDGGNALAYAMRVAADRERKK